MDDTEVRRLVAAGEIVRVLSLHAGGVVSTDQVLDALDWHGRQQSPLTRLLCWLLG